MFLWLVLRQRLLTNVERVRRGLSFDPSCSSCGCYNKTILHILRDCPLVRSFWQSIIPQADHESFFGAPLEHWIVSNIKTSRVFGHDTPPWLCFFPSFLWLVWKRRNDFVFNGECLPLPDIYRIGFVWASHFTATIPDVAMGSHVAIDFIQWVAPPQDWIFDDIPESLRPLLIRDHDGPLYHRRH
ncbi:hypothetical protein V6N12_049933 [Hibiscus sabdariffa]|uniref:Reverse transcriptase zinc-binding domain-containing protein n=1 Tax=Hibiscus sabdariffa TaxID=183260 RepID=A0ABR2GAZ5_9ROSI